MGLVAQLALTLAVGVGHVQAGYAVRYNPGVMAAVAHNRGIAPVSCMVAWTAATERDIGATWLTVVGPAGRRRCLVIDLPQPGKDKAGLVRRHIIVELDYQSGAAVCGVRWGGRARECQVRVRRL